MKLQVVDDGGPPARSDTRILAEAIRTCELARNAALTAAGGDKLWTARAFARDAVTELEHALGQLRELARRGFER